MLRERNFLLLWLGQLVSIFGGRFSELVIPWIILEVTSSPIKAAIVAISTHIAPLLFSLPVGVWIENRPKKKIAMSAELIRAIMMSFLVLVIYIDQFNIFVISSILFITGIAGLFFTISVNTILPGIAGRKRLVEAHNHMEAADAISTLIGPLLAGFVLTAIGAAATLGIDAFSFLLSFIGIACLTIKEKVPEKNLQANKKDSWKQILYGIKLLFSTKIQQFITLNHMVLNFSTHAISLLAIVYANQVLGLTATQTGILLSGAGAGNIVGIFLMNRVKYMYWNKLYGTILFVSGVGVILIALSPNMWSAFAGMFLFDGALSMAFVINGAARQTVTSDIFLARVSSGGFLLAGIVIITANGYAGIVAELFNPVLALLVCAVILLVNSYLSFIQKDLKKSLSSFGID
ncbi:MFS transporter [Virgibacillus necropolis]|uniref:MFS transporter n=1 Tax=Virgibacillus necropolis TaxID=163877 RepID=UPI0038510522